MKAEHRKELQTNLLADRMGRLVQGLRTGPSSVTGVGWVIGVLAVLTVGGWYWAAGNRDHLSEQWVKLDNPGIGLLGDQGGSVLTYDEIARNHPGTVAGRTARFQTARTNLKFGLTSIYSESSRGNAAKFLRDAREQFIKLAAECQGMPLLEQEALFGAARAEETLAGVAEPDSEDRRTGSLDEALKTYREVARRFPDTYEGKASAKKVEELSDPERRARIDKFYKDMSQAGKRPTTFPAGPGDSAIPPPEPPK